MSDTSESVLGPLSPQGGTAIKLVSLGLSRKNNFLKLGFIPKTFIHVFLSPKRLTCGDCVQLVVRFFSLPSGLIQGLGGAPKASAVLMEGPSLQGLTGLLGGVSQAGMVSHQVVKVVVLNCEPSKERMLLSFKLLSDSKKECAGHNQKKRRAVNVGQVPGLLQTSYFSLQWQRAGCY